MSSTAIAAPSASLSGQFSSAGWLTTGVLTPADAPAMRGAQRLHGSKADPGTGPFTVSCSHTCP